MPDGKRKGFNIYAQTREECEKKLAEMIAEIKKTIAAEKANKKLDTKKTPVSDYLLPDFSIVSVCSAAGWGQISGQRLSHAV